MVAPGRILVVDDETHFRESLAELLGREGHEVLQASDGDEALQVVETNAATLDLILLDLRMPGRDGLATLHALAERPAAHLIPVIVVTALGDSQPTIAAMKAGAYDHITKPVDPEGVLRTVARAIERRRVYGEVHRLQAAASPPPPAGALIGHHTTMREVFKLIGKVAPSDAPVLISGESGTGKELVARAIHHHGPHAGGPFIAVNLAALPEALLESELFGHERGAFTGAVQARAGRLELAHEGSLFLDEVGELSAAVQVKLLRALQERAFERLGGRQTLASNFRLIAATNQDLSRLVEQGKFREDLFYRLSVIRIELPPLRARQSDVPELAEHFRQRYAAERNDGPSGLSDGALRALMLHDWPGNVRELENLVRRAVVLARGRLITLEDLPDLTHGAGAPAAEGGFADLLTLPLEEATRELEKRLIRRALVRAAGNKTEAAKLLGIRRQQLYAKLNELGID